MSSDDFVEMMVLDGCFILEYFNKLDEMSYNDFKATLEGWNSSMIETDLILLENQIPYFIIEALLGNSLDCQFSNAIALQLIKEHLPMNTASNPQKIHHLLHLLHCNAVPNPNPPTQRAASEKEEDLDELMVWKIPCATELAEAGVKFKALKKFHDLTKITFQSGTLVIPRLEITDPSKPIYMNLIALEQCMSYQLPRCFSTYFAFFDYLVNTAHDVTLLQRKGILHSMLSSEEEVALFFNESCVGVLIFYDHYLADLFKRVNKYWNSRCHRYRAILSRNYFNNPWSIISLIAAIVLLLLTFAQTFIAIYSYIHPPSS